MAHISIASASVSGTTPHNRESSRTSTLIPEHLVTSAEGLIKLLKDYYDYLNTEGLPSHEINRSIDNHNIDRISASYLDGIEGEIAKNVPNSKVLDRVSLYKKIVKFYSIRGSEDSLYTFFRIFFDEVATVTYPKERLFKLSDGDWDASDNRDEIQIIGNLISGEFDNKSIGSIFEVKDASETVLGTGQLTDFVNVDKSYDFDNVTDGLVMAFDTRENLSPTAWISNTDYPWVGELKNGTKYNADTKDLSFDGLDDYIDLGTLGGNSTITDEHTIIARVQRESATGYHNQSVFNATEKRSPYKAHELYIDRNTGRIGRWWARLGNPPNWEDSNPMIVESGNNIFIQDFKTGTPNFYGAIGTSATTYFKNTAYNGGTGLFNGKPFYVDTTIYYSSGSVPNITTVVDWTETTGFGTVENWPVAKIYYDGNKWVFKGASKYNLTAQSFDSNGVVLCYSEDTDEDAFSANIEWFNDHSSANAFVNTPVRYDFFNWSTNAVIPADGKYHTIALTGNRARKDGYVKVSVDGGDWETIISGDTSTHLNITSTTPIVLGRWTGGSHRFKGSLSHIQYYNSVLTPSQVAQVKNYYRSKVYDFYQLEFANRDGSYYSGATLTEKDEGLYTLNLLTGHEVESFWTFDEPQVDNSGFGPSISVQATYNASLSGEKQKVRWGDLRSTSFTSANTVYHTYTTKDIGDYRDRRGFASDVNRLHDGDFWQEFSYVINSAVSTDQWENEYVRMVHPAGLKFFAAVLYILRLDNKWIGPKVRFDQTLRKYISTYDPTEWKGNYRTNDPLTDLEWMEGLTPPSLLNPSAKAHHMPLFQPGWLTADLRFLELIIEALEFDLGPNDPAYQRLVLSTLHLLHISTKDRSAFAREDYLSNLKFIHDKPITQYLDIKFEDAVFNDPNIFNNIGATIDLSLIEQIRLDTEALEDITTEENSSPSNFILAQGVGVTGREGSGLTANTVLNPPELDRSYSSVYNNDAIGTGHARSMLDSLQAWSPSTVILSGPQWMQIDLGANKTISGVVTQGRYNYPQWVTSYKVEYSTNGTNWFWVDSENVFTGNTDSNTKVTNSFNTNVSARYIRIYPVTFQGYRSMRAGVVETTET